MVHVIITEGDIAISNMSMNVSGGRHELEFSQAIRIDGKLFTGIAVEMNIDQDARKVVYNEFLAKRPGPVR